MSNLARHHVPSPAPTNPNPVRVIRVEGGRARNAETDPRPADVDELAPSPTVCRRGDVAVGRQNGSRMIARPVVEPIEDRSTMVGCSSTSRVGHRRRKV